MAAVTPGGRALFSLLSCLGPVLASGVAAQEKFSHERWNKLLKANVTREGWVNYQNLRTKEASELKAYLQDLEKADLARLGAANEQKAFWINAYNAICIQLLIDEGLPDVVPRAVLFGTNLFKIDRYKVAGKVRTLDEIEHEILRVEHRDPRLHGALVCGAMSCPGLRPEAYAGEKIDQQLDEEVRSWVQADTKKNGERKNYLDRKKNVYYVSKIFDWFQEDFDSSEAGVLAFLRRHCDESDRQHLDHNKVRLEYLDYDWSINKQ
jgi:hypothetical protein